MEKEKKVHLDERLSYRQDKSVIWPKTFRDLDANTLIEKIKSRRNQIVSYAKTFKAHIDKKGLIEEPLKGCEDLNLISPLQKCFDCNNQ